MTTFNFPYRHMNSPLNSPALLDESDYFTLRASVEEIQGIVGDNTNLTGLTIKELLELQETLTP